MMICKSCDLMGCPTRFMSMSHILANAQSYGAFGQCAALHKNTQGIAGVVGTGHEHHRRLHMSEIYGRVAQVVPRLAVVIGHAGEAFHPGVGATVLQEATAVDGDSAGKSRIYCRCDAGDVTTPTDAGDTDAFRIDPVMGSQDGVCTRRGGDRMIGPGILPVWGEREKSAVHHVRSTVRQTLAIGSTAT